MASTTGNEEDNLLIFGYACRVFRDDAQAAVIDAGKHLIPWMGRNDLMVDRYDCRGHLGSLDGVGKTSEDYLTVEEAESERQCDVERYRSLNQDEQTKKDEEAEESRLEKGGAAIGFDYDNPPAAKETEPQQKNRQPPSIRTLAACIEKTAEFIATKGAQMEILMRAKEADNPAFQFLNPDNQFHAIYRQVVEKKKARPKGHIPNALLMQENTVEVEKSLQNLLSAINATPGLANSAPSSAPSDNAYSKLVERLRESTKEDSATPPPSQTSTPPNEPNFMPIHPPLPRDPPPQTIAQQTMSNLENIYTITVTPPPINLQPLIDKTASYASKNGVDVLSVVKKQEPEKFGFLNPGHAYHQFFQYKMALYKEMMAEQREKARLLKGISISTPAASNGSNNGAAATSSTTTTPGPTTTSTKPSAEAMLATKFPTLKGFFQ